MKTLTIEKELVQEKEMLELFQVEELEKRYEFAWISEVVVTASYEVSPAATVEASFTIPIN